MIRMRTLLPLFLILPLFAFAQIDCTDEVGITLTPEVPGNIYCPGEQVLLKTNAGYDSYQWYYNFSNSNVGGTAIGGATANEYLVDINTWGFAYFYAEMQNDTCEYVTDPVLIDSWLFLLPVIASSGQNEYCEGDSTAIYYPSPGGFDFRWYRNGELIPDATDSVYYVTETGTYVLEMSYDLCPDFYQSSGVGPSFTFYDTLEVSIGLNGDQLTALPVGGDPTTIQWYLDGEPIEGGNDLLQTYVGPGNYQVMLTDANGCDAWSEEVFVDFTSVVNPGESAIRVYPNPATEVVYVESEKPLREVRLYGMDGRVLLTQSGAGRSSFLVNLHGLSPGFYRIEIVGNNGARFGQKLIVY